ncbi:MAG: acyltransferase [Spirochaetes bacterium]|nr:MAG: acyltransferase [Spirochaetota bacterium]
MKVGFFQFYPLFGKVKNNLDYIYNGIAGYIRENPYNKPDLLVLPELATSGYQFTSREDIEKLAEPVPGPSTDMLQGICEEYDLRIVTGIAEKSGKSDSKIYNSGVLIGPKNVEGVYRKAHLFFEEKYYFSPGDSGFPVFDIHGTKVGILVCFDHIFPEAARSIALAGAQVVCHPSNLVLRGTAQLTTRVRSIENRIFWILCNRWGEEQRKEGKKLHFTGCSQITSPRGEILADAKESEDSLRVVEIDPSEAIDKHVTELNDLFKDRRPEIYTMLANSLST